WKAALMDDPHGILQIVGKTAMGGFGQIKLKKGLPADKIIKEYIKDAMRLNEQNTELPSATKKARPKKTLQTPVYLIQALKKNKIAAQAYEQFSISAKGEYIEWLEDAKTDATREKRLATAIEWIAEGKTRNWKYKN